MSQDTNQNDCGVVYAATGERYLSEVEVSVTSLRKHMAEISVTVYADTKSDRLADLGVLQESVENPSFNYLDKVIALQRSPYRRTLFLDTDTCITARLDDLFQILERFQVAAAHELARQHTRFPEIPDAFPEFNSGVVALRMDTEVKAMLADWEKRYRALEKKVAGDQDVFRLTCYLS